MVTIKDFVGSLIKDPSTQSVHTRSPAIGKTVLSKIELELERITSQYPSVAYCTAYSPSVIPLLQNKELRNDNNQEWLSQIEEEATLIRSNNIWILIAPDDTDDGHGFDCVPMKYWYTLWENFYRLIPDKVQSLTNTSDKCYRAVVVDSFYLNSYKERYDLWCSEIIRIPCGLTFPDLEKEDNLFNMIEIKDCSTRLQKKYSLDPEVAYAYGILIKRFYGFAKKDGKDDNKVSIKFINVIPDARVFVAKLNEDNSAPLWCKFGSQQGLHDEYTNTFFLRKVYGLRKFLYIIKNDPIRDTLRADYLSLLVSEDESGQQSVNPGQTMEQFYKKYYQSRSKIIGILLCINEFFNALHSPLPILHRWKNVSAHNIYRYDLLLASRRMTIQKKEALPTPTKENQADYRIRYIWPNDLNECGHRGVTLRLEPKDKSEGWVFARYPFQDWRFHLWCEGLYEGSWIKCQSAPDNEIKPAGERIATHLENYREVIKSVSDPGKFDDLYKTLLKKLEHYLYIEFVDNGINHFEIEGSCKVKPGKLLPYDVFPVYLHGDFHPRNVLISSATNDKEDGADQIRVIDLAKAVTDTDDPKSAPMSFDFATFEVDAKARMIMDTCYKNQLKHKTLYLKTQAKLLEELDEEEVRVWDWLKTSFPKFFDRSWEQDRVGDQGDAIKQLEAYTFEQSLPESKFFYVAAWRHLCLTRLRFSGISAKPPLNGESIAKMVGWTPARAYAQALFLCSIGFLKFLDPGKQDDWLRGFACITSAIHALDILCPPDGTSHS